MIDGGGANGARGWIRREFRSSDGLVEKASMTDEAEVL